jgi:hypothetical protein
LSLIELVPGWLLRLAPAPRLIHLVGVRLPGGVHRYGSTPFNEVDPTVRPSMPAPPHGAEPRNVDEPAPLGERGISMINPPLVALALAVVFLVALLVAVLVVGDPAAAYDLATRRLT